jgi:hypothetical protein
MERALVSEQGSMNELDKPPTTFTVQSFRDTRWRQAGAQDNYFALSEGLRALAKHADGEGSKVESAALNLLADLCGMGLDVDTGKGPFRPFVVMDGRRSLLPEDLAENEVEAVAAFCEEALAYPLLGARLADVAWLRISPRTPNYARLAIDAYKATEPTSQNWFRGGREEWGRAIQLCRELGKDSAERLAVIESVLRDIVFREQPDSPSFLRSVADLLARSGMAGAKSA